MDLVSTTALREGPAWNEEILFQHVKIHICNNCSVLLWVHKQHLQLWPVLFNTMAWINSDWLHFCSSLSVLLIYYSQHAAVHKHRVDVCRSGESGTDDAQVHWMGVLGLAKLTFVTISDSITLYSWQVCRANRWSISDLVASGLWLCLRAPENPPKIVGVRNNGLMKG